MKRLIFVFGLLTSVHLHAQKPERVYSVVMERREESWYQLQEKLWKTELDKDAKNANAWYNYYMAVRAQYICASGSSLQIDLNEKVNKIVTDCYSKIPNTFEANLMMYQQFGGLGKSDEYEKNLHKAYEIDPLDSRTYVQLLTHYYVKRDKVKFHEFCEKYYKSNELAGFIYNFGYNVLAEVDTNAIILTSGDNDTYPQLILQEVLGIRKDVTILNIYLLTIDDFRDKIFAEIGLPKFEKRFENVANMEEYESLKKELIQYIFNNSKGLPVYSCITTVSSLKADFGDQLYLTGLNYKYSKESFDNTTIIKRNIEHRYRLDALNESYNFHIQNGKLAEFNSLYLPGFVELYLHYKKSEDWGGLKKIEPLLVKIAKQANQEEEIKKLLSE